MVGRGRVAVLTRVSFARRLTDLADADPRRLAVSCGDSQLTRIELDAAANALARDLAARGVSAGDMVTVALPNSVDWFVAVTGEVMICDADGVEVPPGTEGEVWLRSGRDRPTYRYVGAEPRRRDGGWESLGDHGHVDEGGYLYLGDRIQDMILVGGANVYPAEVEAALAEHPAVRSVVVIGLPDDDTGNRVHAIVEADPAEAPAADLLSFAGERLARYKLPRTVEHVDHVLRDDAGKVRRSELRRQRLG